MPTTKERTMVMVIVAWKKWVNIVLAPFYLTIYNYFFLSY
jgi:hypothetical protein